MAIKIAKPKKLSQKEEILRLYNQIEAVKAQHRLDLEQVVEQAHQTRVARAASTLVCLAEVKKAIAELEQNAKFDTYSEEDLYKLPLSELREMANYAIQQRSK